MLATLPGSITDLAFDQTHNRIYATADDKLYQHDLSTAAPVEITARIPADQFSQRRIFTVAVDPVDPSIVYAGGARNTYSTDTAVVRSTDAGKTWQSLIRSVRLNPNQAGFDGGREAITMRVHPKTRFLWVGTGCYGLWRFGPAPTNRSK